MGCTQSKQAVPVTHDPPAATTTAATKTAGPKKTSFVRSQETRPVPPPPPIASPHRSPGRRRTDKGNAAVPMTPQRSARGNKGGASDPAWGSIWESLHTSILDPTDVHSVIGEVMAHQVNKLSATEITFLQRRIRQAVSALPKQSNAHSSTHKMMNRFIQTKIPGASPDSGTESRSIVQKYHQLDEGTLKKIFYVGDSLVGRLSDIDPLACWFILGAHLSCDALWDRVAYIATDSAKRAGLVLDVNQKRNTRSVIPTPATLKDYLPTEAVDVGGIQFHALAYLVSMALRGTREQRLQLLFFISLSPKTLSSFLISHPGGGLPTWLLEVGTNVVFSLTSLTHYYHFGRMFCPNGLSSNADRKRKFTVNAKAHMEWTRNILSKTIVARNGNNINNNNNSGSVEDILFNKPTATTAAADVNGDSPKASSSPHRQSNNGGVAPAWRRGSDMKDESGHSSKNLGIPPPREESMMNQYLTSVREGKLPADEPIPASYAKFQNACNKRAEDDLWTMEQFVQFADEALDDDALGALFYRLVGAGVFPSAKTEENLVRHAWKDWQSSDVRLWSDENAANSASMDYFSKSVQQFFHMSADSKAKMVATSPAFGGIGGFDGRGGVGYGIMYCVDKKWWDSWEAYTGFNLDGHQDDDASNHKRPNDLSNERLLDRYSDIAVAGTLGSYEIMKTNVKKDVDYVLVPPGVWDVLYELYGGGPPLPRMVLPPQRLDILAATPRERTRSGDAKQMEPQDLGSDGVQVTDGKFRLMRLPDSFAVATHPWILHCHVCDASQPYRRGDAGPMSIRIMATPGQPLWRMYSETTVRLPIHSQRAVGPDGRGKARLWKRVDASTKDAASRYGPWVLLCKNRSAILPLLDVDIELEDNYDVLKQDWQAYTDGLSVEGAGLANGDRLMLEHAVLNKHGDFVWPREAAAKAGHAKRLADEDSKFRQSLRGLGSAKDSDKVNGIVGMPVDAMDSSGRWYKVTILEALKNEDAGTDDDREDDEDEDSPNVNGTGPNDHDTRAAKYKRVKIDFAEFGGHGEWVDVESDRLAVPGRFTLGDDGATATPPTPTNGAEPKVKINAVGKKSSVVEPPEQNGGKICTVPGYGACGLANLGNTCYANSAIQCMSYMPLLRSYLLSGQYKANGDLNKDNPLGTGGKLLEEFAELLRVMWGGKYGERAPTRFRVQLGKQRTQFSGADQQDAQELLNYMLDVLHEDSNKVKKKPYVEALEDDWVKINSLPNIGDEAWRRFLRRNRSIMADVAMGQVLNTVTCPVCHFSSRNFDPFNLLSIPFPTVADVVFQCTVVRRATALNCSNVLNAPRKNQDEAKRFKIADYDYHDVQPPSEKSLMEEYVIPMSRLADIGDLRLRLQNVCGIPANRLRLCKAEEITVNLNVDDKSSIKTYIRVTTLPDKEGPCVQVAKSAGGGEEIGTSPPPTKIYAFESTISPRPMPALDDKTEEDEEDTVTDDDDEDEPKHGDQTGARAIRERRILKDLVTVYGDAKECRIHDTDPLPISKAISRSLWPRSENEFKLGLRVDAIDHRDHWFPGSVVEILDADEAEAASGKPDAGKTRVRIHFDNFSSKWDETYTIESFDQAQVCPLYSHATPRPKPTEFLVHHRFQEKTSTVSQLFGQSFFLQCRNEWSTARAGAHILSQTARFLQKPNVDHAGPVDVDEIQEKDNRVFRLYEKASVAISELIDLLLECDRQYVRAALGLEDGSPTELQFRNPSFDATAMSSVLVKRVGNLLHRLPFELRVCTADGLVSNNKNNNKTNAATEEVPFPFSLMRTIGNYMNARHAVVIHWREPSSNDKKSSRPLLSTPVMYVQPHIGKHKSSIALLEERSKQNKHKSGSGGMHLGVCLTEFCKDNQLNLNDNWRCPQCKDFREGKQNMNLWRLPDLLTFHIKRFNCSARWREKITTRVNFPLTGLDMSEWCHPESPATQLQGEDSQMYDLISVVNHYGGMTGGHYVATCKATPCGPTGSEEVAYGFNGTATSCSFTDDEELNGSSPSGWRLGVRKDKDTVNQSKVNAAMAARNVCDSAEPLWLQFDDDLVEPIPPRNVVSEMAYVLFYRRRTMTPSNIAKYSSLE